MNFVRRHMRSRRAKNLSVSQFRTLVRVETGASLSDVAFFLGTSLPTASRLVSGLVTKGYLSRVASTQDRRVCRLSLTARGQTALREAWDGTREAVAVELRRLSASECRRLAASLRQVGPLFAAEVTE